MKSSEFRFLKQASSTAALALLGLVGIASPARADTATLCPSGANQGGFGNTFTAVAGPLDGTCGANSAINMFIPVQTNYARLMWDSSVANYPVGMTLGSLSGLEADVIFAGQPGDQPFYMLSFVDLTNGLGQAAAANQILMIQFQPTTVSGNDMDFDPNASLVNLFDNVAGFYLAGGQQDKRTVSAWLGLFPFLSATSLDQVRIGIGLSGGGTGSESLTVNSLQVTTLSSVPEPSSLLLLLTAVGAAGFGIRRKQLQNRRS